MNIKKISDKELYTLCKDWGSKALEARRKFAGLLPEVQKRRLYEQKGFNSIFEFAAKLAGMSEEQVRIILNLERKFEDKPKLHSLLVSGEVSPNKLVRVASIATLENDSDLAQKAKILSKAAIDTFVKDSKYEKSQNEKQNDLFITKIDQKSLPVHSKPQDISQDVKLMQKLSPELKQKLLVLDKKGLNINEILLELLQKREQEITKEKEELAQEENSKPPAKINDNKNRSQNAIKTHASDQQTRKQPTRYINVRIRKLLKKEHGTKCSEPYCNKPSQHIHHGKPYAIHKNHNPYHLKPLCRSHHELVHQKDKHVQKFRQLAMNT